MSKFVVFRMLSTLVSVGLIMFSLVPKLPANTQDETPCEDGGWTVVDGTQIDLSGSWTATQNKNCKDSADWQFSFPVTITQNDDGSYSAKASDETPMTVTLEGSGITFDRDLTKGRGIGKDKRGETLQVWTGKIEEKDGRIRIYGQWSGAWDYVKKGGYNTDFMMIK